MYRNKLRGRMAIKVVERVCLLDATKGLLAQRKIWNVWNIWLDV